MNLLITAVAAFLVCATLLLVLRPVAVAVGLVDRPGGHKRHRGDIPVIGGIAIFGGVAIAALMTESLGQYGVMLLVTSAMLVGLGVVDDRFDLPASVRLMGHLTAAMLLVSGSGYQVSSLGDLFGVGALSLGWLAWPFTVVACIALINAFNMLDGMDGLAGGVALVAFVGMLALSSGHGGSDAALLVATCMVGALSAFLLFNVPTSRNRSVRTFMGDSGSTLLGFVVAALSLGMVQSNQPGLYLVVGAYSYFRIVCFHDAPPKAGQVTAGGRQLPLSSPLDGSRLFSTRYFLHVLHFHAVECGGERDGLSNGGT